MKTYRACVDGDGIPNHESLAECVIFAAKKRLTNKKTLI